MRLKDKYQCRWKRAAQRERLFECVVENLTPFQLIRSGIGTGDVERVEGFHKNPHEKFDYMLTYDNKVIAYVDVTGAKNYPPWIQVSKLAYAEKYGVLDSLWIAWFDERKGTFYFINGRAAIKSEGELIWLDGEPTPYKAISLKRWIPLGRWIKILILQTALSM